MSLARVLEAMVKHASLLRKISYLVLASLVVGDFFIPREHVEHFWEVIPGFHAVYGFIACVAIIVVSKFLMHWLMKQEDYYD